MSNLTPQITRTIRSKQVLNAFFQVVRKNLPLDLKKTRITANDILYGLVYSSMVSGDRPCNLRSNRKDSTMMSK